MIPPETRTLVLNNDRTPLNTVGWKTAIKREYTIVRCEHCKNGVVIIGDYRQPCAYCNGKGKLSKPEIIEYHPNLVLLDSAGREHLVPSIIANRHYVRKPRRKVPYSKLNVFKRDNFTCQYCGVKLLKHKLTVDHIIPRVIWKAQESPTCWENIVTACFPCNNKKGKKTPAEAGMRLRKAIDGKVLFYQKPRAPTESEIILGLNCDMSKVPEEWLPYIGHLL